MERPNKSRLSRIKRAVGILDSLNQLSNAPTLFQVNPDISSKANSCPQGGTPTASPAQRVAVGKEAPGPERVMSFYAVGIKRHRSKADFAPIWEVLAKKIPVFCQA